MYTYFNMWRSPFTLQVHLQSITNIQSLFKSKLFFIKLELFT